MDSNQFQTEWITTHLLFPNSAQARDIFSYTISSRSEISENQIFDYFNKCCKYFFKAPTVPSNLIFAEFEESKIKLWPEYFKKLTKEEIAILVGYVFCELSKKQLGTIFKCTYAEIDLKIKNTIYKIIPKNSEFKKINYVFAFKKYGANTNSQFFIYDDIIQYIVENKNVGTSEIKSDLKAEINRSVVFKKYAVQIQNFKDELQNLKLCTYDIPQIKILNSAKTPVSAKNSFFKIRKYVPIVIVVVIFAATLGYRPNFFQSLLAEKNVDTVEIQQIKIVRATIDTDKQLPEIQSTSMPLNPTQIKIDEKINPLAAQIITANSEQKKPIPDLTDKKIIDKNKSGGLFRGRLTVTDVQQVILVAKEKIIGLGGKKAGEVELGWMKNEGTSYFHFSFPDENKSVLEDFLKQFGALELVFEPHPRSMPKGFKRYIIEIKQNE